MKIKKIEKRLKMSTVHSYDIDSMVNAAADGNIAWVENCLNAGVDINGRNGSVNASHAAIRNNHFAVLKLLIERGANLQMVILLLDAGAPIHVARAVLLVAQTKSIAILQRILARGLDLSGPCDCYNGQTLCHLVSCSVSDVCLFLKATVTLANNDVNARDFTGATALHKAALNHNLTSIYLLAELGADIDAVCRSFLSALHYAFLNSNSDRACNSVYLLLARGTNVCLLEANFHSTVCHMAATRGLFDVVAALMAAGSDLDQMNSIGDTPRSILLKQNVQIPSDADVESARKKIAKQRLDLVRNRALTICIALQPLHLPALQMCEILMHSSTFSSLIAFHQWWAIVTTVKHYFD